MATENGSVYEISQAGTVRRRSYEDVQQDLVNQVDKLKSTVEFLTAQQRAMYEAQQKENEARQKENAMIQARLSRLEAIYHQIIAVLKPTDIPVPAMS